MAQFKVTATFIVEAEDDGDAESIIDGAFDLESASNEIDGVSFESYDSVEIEEGS